MGTSLKAEWFPEVSMYNNFFEGTELYVLLMEFYIRRVLLQVEFNAGWLITLKCHLLQINQYIFAFSTSVKLKH